MGLNLRIQTMRGKPHPEWDETEHVSCDNFSTGDAEFATILNLVCCGKIWLDDETVILRPLDIRGLRYLISMDHGGADRYHTLLNILEQNRDYYIYVMK